MDNLTIPAIGTDDDWLDLRESEQGLLRGRLSTNLATGAANMIVANNSWEMFVVEITDGYSGVPKRAGTAVVIVVARNEDGIETSSENIRFREEED